MTRPIAITEVRLGREVEALVLEVLRSGQLAQGPMVDRLERAFSALCSVRHAVAVSSGTTALIAALEAIGIQDGDEVITTPFTFAATLNAILETGATARFADIEPGAMTLDPIRVAEQMTARTRVIMPVHLYGQPAAMDEIADIAAQHDTVIVEDAAQAHGASVRGRSVGSFGIGCFSFYATKNIASGEGGIVTTDDDVLADHLRVLRNQGMRSRYQYEMPGHNYRLTDLQAAVALPQLASLDDLTARRIANAKRLSDDLSDLRGIVTPVVKPGRTHVFHQYTVRVTGEAVVNRDELARRLESHRIGTAIYYPSTVYEAKCFRQHPRVVVDPMPVAERASREVLSLPVHPWLRDADLDHIVGSVREALLR